MLTPPFMAQRKQMMMFHKNRSTLKHRVLCMVPTEEKKKEKKRRRVVEGRKKIGEGEKTRGSGGAIEIARKSIRFR